MGARTYQDIHTIGRNRVLIAGSFAPDTANPPTGIRGAGIRSVVRSAQGRFTVTLMDVWNQCDSAKVTLQLAAAAARSVQVGTINLAARTVVLRVVDAAGAEQDVAANANNRINFELVMRHGRQEY
jgi:hypothetical protein